MTRRMRGFSAIQGLLIAILVIAIGFGAIYAIARNDSSSDTAQTNEDGSLTVQSDNGKTYTVSYNGWIQNPENTGKNANDYYREIGGDATLDVYTTNNPRIYGSFTPKYCEHVDGVWTAFSSEDGEKYSMDESSDACNEITETTIGGVSGHARYGGGIGLTKYIAVFDVGDTWYVFSDYTTYENDNPTTSEIATTKDAVKASVESLVAGTIY